MYIICIYNKLNKKLNTVFRSLLSDYYQFSFETFKENMF